MTSNNEIKVSIIVPVFNVCKYLPECLDSIIGQTLKNIEILCGDGGSNDGSLEILREYEKKDSRIKVISKEKSGYGQSMNDCFDIAKGDYVGIVESDDVVRPEMFERLYAIASENDLDWIRSDIFYYYSMLQPNLRLKKESIIYGGDFYNLVLNPQEDYRPYKSGLRTWSGIYKTSFLRENGIRHNETPGGSYQDVGFYLKTLFYAKKVYFLDEAFYMWRQDNPASSVHYDSTKLVDKSLNEWELDKKYLIKNNLGERAWASYRYRQFFSLRWTLEMAKGPDVERVLACFRKEFKEAFYKKQLDKGFFSDYEWNMMVGFLKENRIKIPFMEKKKISLGHLSVRIWMRFWGRILRPYKNYIRRIVDASNEETYKQLVSFICENNEKTYRQIIEAVEEKGDEKLRRLNETLKYRNDQRFKEMVEVINENSEKSNRVTTEIIAMKDNELQEQLRSMFENNNKMLFNLEQTFVERFISKEEFKEKLDETENVNKEYIDKACEKNLINNQDWRRSFEAGFDNKIFETRNRIEDIYNNLDRFIIHPEWGKDERNKNAVNNVLEFLVRGSYEHNRNVCKKNLKFIEIETFSKCNRQCWFCPNKIIDRHSKNVVMPEKLYLKILTELNDIDYSGTISFSRYNEPLIDRLILKRISQAKEYCPNAYLRANSNGDFLNRTYLDELAQAGLQELEVQCYFNQNESVTRESFMNRLEEYASFIGVERYTLLETPFDRYMALFDYDGLRLTYSALNMGIVANNRGEILDNLGEYHRTCNCMIPFKNLYVDYNGKYMMCCNVRSDEPRHSAYIVGDASTDSVMDVFMGEKIIEVRKKVGIIDRIESPCSSCKYITRDDDMSI